MPAVDSFKYRYEFRVQPALLTSRARDRTRTMSVKYFDDEGTELPGGYTETPTGFHRKLVFNFLKVLETYPTGTPEPITATYYYVVTEGHGFVFSIDAVIYKDTAVTPATEVTLPAQYHFVRPSTKTGASPIKEYLWNLGLVNEMQDRRHRIREAVAPGRLIDLDELKGLVRTEEGRLDRTVPRPQGPLFGPRSWPSFAGCVVDEVTLRQEGGEFVFVGKAELKRHPLGEFAAVVPIPRFENNPNRFAEHAIVSCSWSAKCAEVQRRGPLPPVAPPRRSVNRAVQTAFEELTRVLWRKKSGVAWIMGEPGSGKEVFARALHYGAARAKTDTDPNGRPPDGLETQSVAGVTLREFNQRLFGATTPNGPSIVEVVDEVHGTVFLDEFDKPKEPREIYSALLRVWEAKQFIKIGISADNQIVEAPQDAKSVSWIMAGAFSQRDPRKTVPHDLWGRLGGFIRLDNPVEEDGYGAALFLYQYLRLVANLLDDKSVAPLIEAIRKQPDARNYPEAIASKLIGVDGSLSEQAAFVPWRAVGRLADEFQLVLRTKRVFASDRLDTARGIFKATEAAFNYLKEMALDRQDFSLNSEDLRGEAVREARKAIRLSRGPM